MGIDRTPSEQVEVLARLGLAAGLRGFVCSPQEAAALRALTGPEGVLVVPGIRPRAPRPATRSASPPRRSPAPGRKLSGRRPSHHPGPDPAEAAEAIVKEMAVAL